jgi:hypothetical protein
LGCTTIAFPAIGTGVARISHEVAAREMSAVITEALLVSDQALSVELYLLDRFGRGGAEESFEHFERFLRGHFAMESSGQEGTILAVSTASRVLQQLDERRRVIEAELVSALRDGSSVATFHEQLLQIAELRALYAPESRPQPSNPTAPASVFVSSTFEDLKAFRSRVRQVIQDLGMAYIGMEDFEATASAPAELIARKVRESGRYLGLIGARYGYVDSASGLSMTELEYSQAVATSKPIHMFVMDESVPIPMSAMERDPEKLTKLERFRARVMQAHTCVTFRNEEDLAHRVEVSLRA